MQAVNELTIYFLVIAGYIQLDKQAYFVIAYCFKAVNQTRDDLYWAENSGKMLDCIGPRAMNDAERQQGPSIKHQTNSTSI